MSVHFDEDCLRDIIRKAIKNGKLFELIFTEDGQRLWSYHPNFKKMVKQELKSRKEK